MIQEILKETHLDAYLDYFGFTHKEFKKEKMKYALMLVAVGLIIAVIAKTIIMIPVIAILAFLGYKFPYLNLMQMMSHNNLKREILFPQFLRTFMALLSSQGNPYQTLVKSTEYMKDPIKTDLEKLIILIEDDNDLKHYVEFADKIGTSDAQMVMSMIYSFTKSGIVFEELEELERTIETMKTTKMKDLVTRKTNKQETYANYVVMLSIFFVMCYVFTSLVVSMNEAL